ncbi:MAG: hypothetical protein K2H16_04085 [Prevotella sp.]|nr:hypothetical protein [Prevotella sp.]
MIISILQNGKKTIDVFGITPTVRNGIGRKMTVIPYHALNKYFSKLIRAGLRVSICDQPEELKIHAKIAK